MVIRVGKLCDVPCRGTKGYQHPGSLLDPATAGFADDRYAYGVMLWEMLCGQSAREHLADQLEALEDLQPQQWAVVAAELALRGWDEEDLDACAAAAHAFGFISLEEVPPPPPPSTDPHSEGVQCSKLFLDV